MNNEPDNGGPAFPQAPIKWNDGNGDCVATGSTGMSLRDWFAGMALQGFSSVPSIVDELPWDSIASMSYDMADSMLAERKPPQ